MRRKQLRGELWKSLPEPRRFGRFQRQRKRDVGQWSTTLVQDREGLCLRGAESPCKTPKLWFYGELLGLHPDADLSDGVADEHEPYSGVSLEPLLGTDPDIGYADEGDEGVAHIFPAAISSAVGMEYAGVSYFTSGYLRLM